MATANIYVLKDPRTNAVRYVGVTTSVSARLKRHCMIKPSERTYRANWIRSLIGAGFRPLLETVEVCGLDEAYDREQHWIKVYRDQGAQLTNSSDGGRGLLNPPDSVRIKKSQSLMGHSVSDKTRRAVSLAHKGKALSVDQKLKISLSLTGKNTGPRGALSDSHRRKVSESLIGNQRRKGIPHDAESRAKISAAHKGRKKSAEWRAKISAAHKGKKLSEARRQQMSATMKGRKLSAETRAKMSAAQKRRQARARGSG